MNKQLNQDADHCDVDAVGCSATSEGLHPTITSGVDLPYEQVARYGSRPQIQSREELIVRVLHERGRMRCWRSDGLEVPCHVAEPEPRRVRARGHLGAAVVQDAVFVEVRDGVVHDFPSRYVHHEPGPQLLAQRREHRVHVGGDSVRGREGHVYGADARPLDGG